MEPDIQFDNTPKPPAPAPSHHTVLFCVITAVVVAAAGGGAYFWQHQQAADKQQLLQKQIDDLKKQLSGVVASDGNIDHSTGGAVPKDETTDWKTYTSSSQKFSFKYPPTWHVQETDGRVYVRNYETAYSKDTAPADYQQIWLSYDPAETSAELEQTTKSGQPVGSVVSGAITAGEIKTSQLTIRTYSYTTIGGAGFQAYWQSPAGKRFAAKNATEIGEANQASEVEILEKVLGTVTHN